MYKLLTSDKKVIKLTDGKYLLANMPVNANVQVNENTTLRASIPTDFAGLSININIVCDFITLAESNPAIAQLYRNLGNQTVRLGLGDSRYYYPDQVPDPWPPTTYINKDIVNRVCAIFTAVDWDVKWLINLRNYDPVMFPSLAGYVYSILGSQLLGVEIGNETDRYVDHAFRDPTWAFPDFLAEWDAYEAAIHTYNASIPLCAASSGDTTWTQQIVTARGSKLAFVDFHSYPTTRDGTGYIAATVDNLLSKRVMDTSIADAAAFKAIADGAGLPTVLGECNSVAASGKDGISNAFAATLWGIDHMFSMLKTGLRRLNYHGSYEYNNTYYAPILHDGTPSALYYAMLVFHYAAPNGNLVSTSVDSTINVASHSVVRNDGTLAVTVVNKDTSHVASVRVTPTGMYTSATIMYMTAPSLTSQSSFRFGGQSVSASDGTWSGTSQPLKIINNSYVWASLPVGSAAVIVFSEAT